VKTGLKIGITAVAGINPVSALWSSGINQNIVYLGLLLQRLPEVGQVSLVSCPAGAQLPHPLADMFGLMTIDLADAVERLDVIIELGARAEPTLTRKLRERGGRLVSYMAGNTMVMNFEAMSNRVPYGDNVIDIEFDSVWITPQHWRTNRSYAHITRSPHVEMAPHIWSPMCLEQSAFRLKTNPHWRPPQNGKWRLGVFDPNVNVVKTFHFPLLVAEQCWRLDQNLIDRILLFSANHLIGNPHFEQFCASLDIRRAGKVFAEARFPLAQVLGEHIDAVVTHQWENALNYLYWDVLYLGWPLVHNSEMFKETGYYYPEFDPVTGGQVLRDALRDHAKRAPEERSKVLETLWRFHIDNPLVQRQHSELLERLMG